MSTLLSHIKDYLKSNHLTNPGDTIVIGVSGGPDSVALVRILYALRHELGVNLHVAHYNHHLRRSANHDETFVKTLAEKLSLPYSCGAWENPPAKRTNIEEQARKKRLAYFADVIKKTTATSVALAHTEDDLAETVLMRLIRGSGISGMRSILPKRTIEGMTIIRPLLCMQKKELLAYLKTLHQPFCTDPTNRQTVFTRNKIRLELLPFLAKNYTPAISHVLANFARISATDYDYLADNAEKAFKKNAHVSSTAKSVTLRTAARNHPAITRMLFRMAFKTVHGDTTHLTLQHIIEIEELTAARKTGSVVDLPAGVSVTKTPSALVFTKRPARRE